MWALAKENRNIRCTFSSFSVSQEVVDINHSLGLFPQVVDDATEPCCPNHAIAESRQLSYSQSQSTIVSDRNPEGRAHIRVGDSNGLLEAITIHSFLGIEKLRYATAALH